MSLGRRLVADWHQMIRSVMVPDCVSGSELKARTFDTKFTHCNGRQIGVHCRLVDVQWPTININTQLIWTYDGTWVGLGKLFLFWPSSKFRMYVACHVIVVCSRRSRCICMSHRAVWEQPVVAGFLWQPAFCGTVWQMMCDLYGLDLCLLTATARPTKTLLLHVVISDS